MTSKSRRIPLTRGMENVSSELFRSRPSWRLYERTRAIFRRPFRAHAALPGSVSPRADEPSQSSHFPSVESAGSNLFDFSNPSALHLDAPAMWRFGLSSQL